MIKTKNRIPLYGFKCPICGKVHLSYKKVKACYEKGHSPPIFELGDEIQGYGTISLLDERGHLPKYFIKEMNKWVNELPLKRAGKKESEGNERNPLPTPQ